MDHYRDLSAYTANAANTVQTKAVSDAARLVADYAIGSVWHGLDEDTQEQFYGWLRR